MIEALVLICTLQAVSADGQSFVGPVVEAKLAGPPHTELVADYSEIELVGALSLGIAERRKTAPNFHGSVQLIATSEDDPRFGLLIPDEREGGFDIFWAINENTQQNDAPTSVVSGNCFPQALDSNPEEKS